jgi:hypothetical protein
LQTERETVPGVAVVTVSFSRDFELCRDLNASVLRFWPALTKHYIIVDRCDLEMFSALENERTIVSAVEDVIPRGYMKLSFSKRWWLSTAARRPALGWLVQQLVKISFALAAREDVLVNVDSDVRFIRPVDPSLFAREGLTRLYRLPGGIVAGMNHVKWHRNVTRLLGVKPDSVPMADYVGNLISWNRRIVRDVCTRIEAVSGLPWHVAFTRGRLVSEYLTYGLFVDKVIGREAAGVWVDERSWCHTFWGPEPLSAEAMPAFVSELQDDDVAFSIAGYTGTSPEVCAGAIESVTRLAESSASTSAPDREELQQELDEGLNALIH